ncbi:MAG: EAL domain-containing protein, partial [Cyanobacteriota bacterium]
MSKTRPHVPRKAFHREHVLHQITNRIRQSLELPEILSTAAREIQRFLRVDRVKIYRFAPDGSGEVIAEAIHNKQLPSLLHLHFPASDIPQASRDLFVRARQRVITDVSAQHQMTHRLDHPDTGESLIQQDIRHAPADPCHVQYLNTMGVQASLVVPVLHQRQLWGLLAAHHSKPRHFSERELQVVQLSVDQLSIAIAQANLLAQTREQVLYESTLNQVSQLLHSPLSQSEIRQQVLEAIVAALKGAGGRLYIAAEPGGEVAQLYVTGEQPNSPNLEQDPVWQELLGRHTEGLSALTSTRTPSPEAIAQLASGLEASLESDESKQPEALRFYTFESLQANPRWQSIVALLEPTSIRAIALIPLQFHHQFVGYLGIFRSGYDQEILWAGQHQNDIRNTMPRASFAAWREIKLNQAPEWTTHDIRLANSVAIHLYLAVTQRRVEAMMRYQASHDALTSLPNRLLFNDQLSLALASAQQDDEMLGVAFLDLDRFKLINDSLGHAAGDELLQEVARRLRACLRPCDAIARWGGDEFTLVLPHLHSAEDITHIAQRILDRLTSSFYLGDQELYITASLGIALFPYDGADVETLLKNADLAMYQAKQQGKNNYQIYHEGMAVQTLNHLALESDLRKALSREELLLHYQPQIDLATGAIVGVEALLRWQHPLLGFVSPAQFIPLAEESGIICSIGEWVLQTACRQQRAWQDAGLPPMRMAVNLSAQQFQQSNLATSILQTLEETGMEPQYLELEITESAAMRDVQFTSSTLSRLVDLGVQIAMDDFGTGYSSLSVIKHFPLHTLKIDQSFVRDAPHNSSDVAIANTVVALGRGLGLKVLAEGVETAEQVQFLRSIQCDFAQGYYFSRPLPPEAIAPLLMGNR